MAFVIGVKRLRDLIIDTAKDWLGYSIKNVGAPTAATDVARKQEVDAHANRTDNPHQVTAAQVGAVSKAGDTMTGIFEIQVSGGRVLRLKSVDPAIDHLYIEFYADAHNPNSRSAWFGFGGVGTNILSLQNQMGGPINLIPGSGQPLQVSGYTVWHAGNLRSVQWVQPGDTIMLEALTERSTTSTSGVIVKRFRPNRPGRYRITGELKASSSYGATASIFTEFHGFVGSFSTTSTSYVAFIIDFSNFVYAGEVIEVSLRANTTNMTAYIRNVRLRYADAPDLTPAVLQD